MSNVKKHVAAREPIDPREVLSKAIYLMREPEVLRVVGNPHPNTLRNLERRNRFPRRTKLGFRTNVWNSHEVARWALVRLRIDASPAETA